MARKFERGPQGVTNPNRGDGPDSEEQFSALLSRILSSTQDVAESTAATRAVSVVSYTTTPVSDNGAFFTASMGSDNVFGIASSTADSFTTSYYYSSSSSTGPGTTIARPTSSSTLTAYGQQQTSLPGPTETSLSTAQNSGNANDNNGGGELSTGQLVAVIVVPIAVAALVVLLAVLVFRRRRERDGSRQQHARPDDSSGISSNNKTNNNQGSGAIFGLREKWSGSRRSSASSQQQQQQQQQPIRLEVTSHYNNSYMTGLDTSSRSSSLQDDEPPPYPFDITHTAAPSPRRLSRRLTDLRPQKMTRLQIPQHHPTTSTSTTTATTMLAPIPPVSPLLPRFLSPSPSFLHEQHRPGTSPSINSDVYSDNASIHSARAARMSIGSPTMILHRGGTHHSDSPRGSTGDPFDDPDSPVGRSRQGSAASQASDVSKGLDV